jgi:cyclophilin family peptidyl-prolyl cis-trans isomerase
VGTDKRQRQKANRERARQERIRKQKLNKVRSRGLRFGLGIPLVVLALFLVANLVTGDDDSTPSTDTAPATSQPAELTPCPAVDGEAERVDSFNGPMENCIDPSKSYIATFDTTEGEIVVELDTQNTPGTVNNFVSLARYRYYDTTTIFRTDPSIDIIQGGGFSASDSVGYTIADEGTGFEYSEGDLVMARSQGPNSGGAQFFFVTGPKASLLNSQGTYVTFGKITQGLNVVKAIQALHSPTDDGLGGKPSRTVTVNSVTITEK